MRDVKELTRDELAARFDRGEIDLLEFFEGSYRAGAEAMRERVEDIDVLIQVADYLNQVGGGPMEDRLRLLYEALRSAPIEGEKV